MNFPDTNKIHRDPIPKAVEANAKMLEEHLSKVNWKTFGKVYTIITAYVLGTVFAFIVVIGIAKAVVKLFS